MSLFFPMLSLLLWFLVATCYAVRPISCAAVTVFPTWLWLVPGLFLAGLGWDSTSLAGAGWGSTITNEYPFHRVDQTWLNPHLRPMSVRAYRTQHSDHRLVVCDALQ